RGISSQEGPKRPLTAYFRFMKDNHSAFREKNPGLNNVEIMKKIASAWRELPASQKQVYEEVKKADWQRYTEQLAAYRAQLTPAQAIALDEEKRKRWARRRSLRAKRELTALGKPKRPRSSFNIFVSENYQETEGISPVAKMKKLFTIWGEMSSSQKQPYVQLAQDDKVRYENEMTSWEARMVELGREDLIRIRKRKPTRETAQRAKAPSRQTAAKLKLTEGEE
ncbi:TFAM factor, partial [Urocolius indicus]|nr:TFAM factor [Urocolius indicus]